MSESLGEQLWDAAGRGKAAEVTRLLAAGAEVNWGCPGYDMATPLHRAADWGHSDCVRVLLAHPGCDVDARTKSRETPLMDAAWQNQLEVAALLLQAGADTRAEDERGQTALDVAGRYADDQTLTGDMTRLLTDPAILSLGNSLMSDEALQTRLQSLPSDMRYRVLLLQGNHLTRVPDLTKLPQFSQLQVLNMADNKLTEVREEHLPASVMMLYLGYNPIHTMSPQLVSDWLHSYFHLIRNSMQSDRRQVILHTCPIVADVQQKVEGGVYDVYGPFRDTQRVDRLPDLSHMETVREVLLPFQDITRIDGTHFPVAVENINVNHNMIEDVTHIKELKCLRKISLSGNKLKSMPEFPDNMEHIDLDDNNLEDPPDIKQLKCLKKISLSGNKLKSTPEFPDNMEDVDLDNNNLEDPPDIKQLKCLKKISLSGNKLKSTPEFPDNMEHVVLDNNNLEDPPDIKQLKCLKKISLSGNKLKSTPEFPDNMEDVDLDNNNLEDPPDIKQLKCLKKISLSRNKLKSTPEFPENIEHVDLDDNNLEDPPDIKQLKCLKKISLSGNKLKSTPEFPDNMEHVVLDNNNLEDPPDIKQLKCLKKISLSRNKLKSMPEFPDNTEHIDVSHNALQSVTNLSKLKKMKALNIADNKIVVLLGISSSLQSLQLKDNPIRTLHRDCFPSEEVYKLLSKALTWDQVYALQQPPPQIFRRGYEAVIQYYDQAAMSHLTDSYSNRLAVVGEASAGKTSLVQTLIHGVPCLTGVDDRTEVVQTHTWRLPDGCTYQVFDQGGQKIYAITNRFFLSKDSKNLICHNIKEGSIATATEMLKNILHQFPNGHIHFGLTKLDLIKDEEVLSQKLNNFRVTILKTFEDQIALLKSQTKAESDVNLITSYENRKKTVCFFPVSSQNVQGTSEIASFFHDIAKENKQVVPQHWLDCLESIQKNKEPFLSLSEFKAYYDKCDPSATTEDSSTTSLRYFSDCGLVIWYEDHPTLKDFVFHNIQYLISLMKCVFRHDLVEHLSYDKNTDLKKVFNKTVYKKNIEEFQTQGLLSLKLLTYLWKDEFGAEVEKNKDKFLELMKCLDICQEVWAKNSEKKYFFPWFVTDEEEPLVVKEMCTTDDSHIMLNLECIFTPDIPNNVTELMIVHLQRLASEKHYLGDRKAWRDGLYISDSHSEASVLREPKTHSLQIYVKNNVGEIFTTWKDFLQLKDSLAQILSQWCGIEESIHIPCFHCKYIKKSEPKLWPLEDVFSTGREKVYTSCSGDKEVPAALVTMINTGDDEGKQGKHIQAVERFLSSNAQDKKFLESAEKTSPDSAHPRQRRIQQIPDISDRSLCIVARQIGHDWKDVCDSLGITQGEQETLEYDNRFNLTARITNMLIQWRQRQEGDPSDILNILYSTFHKCGFKVESDQTIEKGKVQETAPYFTTKLIPNLQDMSEPSLNTVAGQIGHQWMEVGYLLGFTKAELENIEHDYTRLIDINTNILIQWKQRQEGDLSEDQMLNTLNSTFQECKLENKAYWTIEDETQVDRIGVAKYRLKEPQTRVVQTKMSPNAGVDQQNREATKDYIEQMVQRAVQIKISPYEDYAFRLPQIRNHHQTLVDNIFVPDVLDYLVPYFSVDDYEAIKVLEGTPRNQARMFLYMVDKRGRTALDVLIQAVREIPHLRHLLVHLQHQEEDGAQRRN